LGQIAREAIHHEAPGIDLGQGVQPVLDNAQHEIERHQFARVHVRLGALAQFGARGDFGAQ